MPTFREFLRVAELTVKDKTSGKRMKEIHAVLKKHEAFSGLTPDKATAILEDLGPTYVKVGQIASNRSDLLSKDYSSAFEKLRTDAPPMSFDVVVDLIENALGHPWEESFSSLEPRPLGSASIAQVHKATLSDGSIVAIKVQRPGIAEQMAEDITLIKHLLALVEFSTAGSGSLILTMDDLVTEIERTTADELDFTVELNNLFRFHNELAKQEGVGSPLPYPNLSSRSVLVMEFATGTLLNNKEALVAEGKDLTDIGERLAQSYVTQVIDNGFFHADPHPGNILICGDRIVWIDLGMTGSLTAYEREVVGRVFRGVAMNDPFVLKEALLSIAKASGSVDHSLLLEQMSSVLASYTSVGLSDINIGMALTDVMEILRSQNLALPPSFTMLARGFLTLEGVLTDIAPTISIVDIVSKHVEGRLSDFSTIRAKAKDVVMQTAASAEAMTRIPKQVSNTLDMLDRGQLKVNADMKIPDNALATLYVSSGRMSMAFISAGLFIGSSILCTTAMEPRWLGVPVLGVLGYLGAFVLGAYVIWRTIVTRHRQVNNEQIK